MFGHALVCLQKCSILQDTAYVGYPCNHTLYTLLIAHGLRMQIKVAALCTHQRQESISSLFGVLLSNYMPPSRSGSHWSSISI